MLSPAEVADVAELNQLAYRYAAAVDACDVDAFLNVFSSDAELKTFVPGADQPFGVSTGHAELANVPKAMSERFTRTAHLMTNHLIDLDGDRARGSLLCTARHFYASTPGGTDLVVVIRYVDKYDRRDGRWLIADREIRFLWSETHSTLADDQVMGILQRS